MEFEENFPAPGCVVSVDTHARLFSATFPKLREYDEEYLFVKDKKDAQTKRKNTLPAVNVGASTSQSVDTGISTVNFGASTSRSVDTSISAVNFGASTPRGHVETPEKMLIDSERTISISQSLIDYEIALDMSDDIGEMSVPGISPCESMGFDAELFDRYLDSVVDAHAREDASNATDGIISDNINNDVNMGIQFDEDEDGKKNLHLFFISPHFIFYLYIFPFK